MLISMVIKLSFFVKGDLKILKILKVSRCSLSSTVEAKVTCLVTPQKVEYIYDGDTLVQSKDVEEMYLNMSITTSLII